MQFPDVLTVFTWLLQGTVAFVFSTFLFDALHWLLHVWRDSRFSLLRRFASWHWVHHELLDKSLQVNRNKIWPNIWAHVMPEFITGVAGTLLLLIVFPWQPIVAVLALRVVFLAMTLREEGLDANHMAMERVRGQQNMVWVDQSYHAMHHVYPSSFFSSYLNLFDLIFGKALQFKGRRIALTGAGGSFGAAMKAALEKRGAEVRAIKWGHDFDAEEIKGARAALEWAEILILAHGAKSETCMQSNCTSFVQLIEAFREIGRNRLVPPEVWALGSEAELHGSMGDESIRDYADSKQAFARFALDYYHADDLIYRHIVPSAFQSAMGPGPMSGKTAVAIALFFLSRGFRYIPVTLTTLAFWNYFRFRWFQKPLAPQSKVPAE